MYTIICIVLLLSGIGCLIFAAIASDIEKSPIKKKWKRKNGKNWKV